MIEYHVTAPDAGFSGEACGVVFRDGTAVVPDDTKPRRAALEYFRRRGYAVAPAPDANTETPSAPAAARKPRTGRRDATSTHETPSAPAGQKKGAEQ